jgi:hypothetical protein
MKSIMSSKSLSAAMSSDWRRASSAKPRALVSGNNRYGLDAHAATATAWNTSIRYYGGHFACGTGINPALDRFGVRFSRGAADAYNNHNRHVFDAPNFELRQLDPNSAIPFLNGRSQSPRRWRRLQDAGTLARHA